MVIRKVLADRPSGVDAINSASGKLMGKAAAIPFRALRNIFDGVAGTSAHNYGAKEWRDKHGNARKYNPIQKTGRRATANLETMLTGRRTHANTREVMKKDEDAGFAKRQWNRGWAGVHFVSNMTVGMAGASLGWGARAGVGLTGMATVASARPMARFIGGATYETAGTVKEMVGGVRGLSRNPTTSDMMLMGAFGAATIGGLAIASDSFGDKKYSGQAESIPGTMSGSQTMVDTGADGDLVFALHNMR